MYRYTHIDRFQCLADDVYNACNPWERASSLFLFIFYFFSSFFDDARAHTNTYIAAQYIPFYTYTGT